MDVVICSILWNGCIHTQEFRRNEMNRQKYPFDEHATHVWLILLAIKKSTSPSSSKQWRENIQITWRIWEKQVQKYEGPEAQRSLTCACSKELFVIDARSSALQSAGVQVSICICHVRSCFSRLFGTFFCIDGSHCPFTRVRWTTIDCINHSFTLFQAIVEEFCFIYR